MKKLTYSIDYNFKATVAQRLLHESPLRIEPQLRGPVAGDLVVAALQLATSDTQYFYTDISLGRISRFTGLDIQQSAVY